MAERLRWGILATGWIADIVTSDLRLNGFTVTAVGSRDLARARVFAAEHGIASAYGSYEELVAADDVDVVYIATPHPFHAANALMALSAGKHVLVEKAFTLNAAQAAAVADLARERGLVAMEAMWTRYLPHMARLRELLADHALGEVKAVFADHGQKLPSDPSHRIQNPALGGGALLDLGIYPISFAWQVFGEPEHIDAVSTPTATGVDAQTAVVFTYPDGAQALTHMVLDAASPTVATVIGTEARVDIDPAWYMPTSFTLRGPDGTIRERYTTPPISGSGRHFQAAALERIVASGQLEGPELPLWETVAIMGTLDAIRRQIGLRYPSE
ncbi:MAG: Gfo/Idh/MocA family oxidoreductase [Bifidobacteriaceae bacterium]|jgi:predicted dehydrogenase|nr:Gfo/Idh/MocA family oxidoreductase [Bifidobacteriaceae bacterium]